jgi:hypothetical protein
MRAAHTSLCLLLLAAIAVRADEVSRTVDLRNECAGAYGMQAALSSDTLHNQVSSWSHGRKVSNWVYEPSAASVEMLGYFRENPTLQCVRVHYTADFDMPAVFSAFLNSLHIDTRIQIRVKKEVCMHAGSVLVEIATVSEHIVGDVHIATRSEIVAPGTLATVSHMAIDVPWYAAFLNDHILDSLARSVREKVDVVAKSLCAAPSFSFRRLANRTRTPTRAHALPPV